MVNRIDERIVEESTNLAVLRSSPVRENIPRGLPRGGFHYHGSS
jgi:hypothetical protein